MNENIAVLEQKPVNRLKRLTKKHERFVENYCRSLNVAEATRLSGYKGKYPEQIGHRLVTKDYIKVAIDARLEQIKEDSKIKPEQLIEFWRNLLKDDKLHTSFRIKASELLARVSNMLRDNSTTIINQVTVEPRETSEYATIRQTIEL